MPDPRHHTPPARTERARAFRRPLTPPETRLWRHLRDRALGGLKFRRQYALGPYFADFYCPSARVVVELDGDSHVEQAEHDERRTAWLEGEGYRVIRFSNADVYRDLEAVLEGIAAACGAAESDRPPSPQPSPQGEREPAPPTGALRLKTSPKFNPACSGEDTGSLSPWGEGWGEGGRYIQRNISVEPPTQPLQVSLLHLGRTAYLDALAAQREVHERRKAGACRDTLILTEHEPVLTLGRGADRRHLRVSEETLSAMVIDVVPVERGGDVTYHGLGQLVAYPILDLRDYGRDIHRYVRALEESAIRLLASYGVRGERRPGTPGVWAGEAKIASVGVFVSRWVTLHGIAINICPDLTHFDLIDPCGLVGMRMTSLARELGRDVLLAEAEQRYVEAFAAVLEQLARDAAMPVPATP